MTQREVPEQPDPAQDVGAATTGGGLFGALNLPMAVIGAAIRQVPAVGLALGLAGIAASASIVSHFVGTGVNATLAISLVLVGMIVLSLVSTATRRGDEVEKISLPANILRWTVLVCFCFLCVCFTSAVTFAVPENFAVLLDVKKSLPQAISKTDVLSANYEEMPPKADFGYIYLGRREGDRWADDRFAYGSIVDTNAIPQNGDVREIVQPVHLRRAIPDESAPLIMSADLGVLKVGTKVKIKTVTKLQPEGYYWASVTILK